MRLRIATSVVFVAGVLMLVCWPFIIGKQPPHDHVRDLARYTLRFGLYVTLLVVLFFVVVAMAAAVARSAREEYREESRRNLDALIEGALRDHGRPADGDSPGKPQ